MRDADPRTFTIIFNPLTQGRVRVLHRNVIMSSPHPPIQQCGGGNILPGECPYLACITGGPLPDMQAMFNDVWRCLTMENTILVAWRCFAGKHQLINECLIES